MFDCTYLNMRIREFSNAQSKKREYFEKLAAYFTKRFCDIFQSFVKNTRIANNTEPCGKRKTETEVSACSFSYSLAHYAVNVIVIVALVFETLSMRMSKLIFLLSFLA